MDIRSIFTMNADAYGGFMAQDQNRIAGGYLFSSEKDAQLARAEEQKAEYLEERIDYSRPEAILHVYQKSIHERIFRTPVGMAYLKKLQNFLLSQEDIAKEDVEPIAVYSNYSEELKAQDMAQRERKPKKPKNKIDIKNPALFVSIVLNLLLAIAIGAMFSISLRSDNPNIINYEANLQNKYSAWEQELTQKDQTLREKEKELTERENALK